jgi:hypothetical protein
VIDVDFLKEKWNNWFSNYVVQTDHVTVKTDLLDLDRDNYFEDKKENTN